MASVRSSEALCRTRLRMWMKMSQLSKLTTLEKAGQKAGGAGGHKADNKCSGKKKKTVQVQISHMCLHDHLLRAQF